MTHEKHFRICLNTRDETSHLSECREQMDPAGL